MKRNRGQVGLLIVIVVGVLVALIMSVASGVLNDVVLSRQAKEGGTALHVAEQGVEEALNLIRQNANLGEGSAYHGNVSFNNFSGVYSVKQEAGLGIYVKEGDVVEVDLSDYANDDLTIEWVKKNKEDEDVVCSGEGSGQAPAALEIIKMLKSGGVSREYVNAADCDLSANNGFANATAVSGEFTSRFDLSGMTNVSKLRIRPIYNGTTVGLVGISLPSQVYVIHSTGEGDVVDKEIEVKRSRDRSSSIFDFALFTGGTIVK